MARGNKIIVTNEPRGIFEEGYVAAGETHYPGMVVQRDPTVALKGGRFTYKIYDRSVDGEQPLGAFWIVTELLQGKTVADGYAAGARESLYSPIAGEEINLLIANVAGTATIPANTLLIVDDGTGKLIATTGSPETEVAQLLEAVVDVNADVLAWCQWTGH